MKVGRPGKRSRKYKSTDDNFQPDWQREQRAARALLTKDKERPRPKLTENVQGYTGFCTLLFFKGRLGRGKILVQAYGEKKPFEVSATDFIVSDTQLTPQELAAP